MRRPILLTVYVLVLTTATCAGETVVGKEADQEVAEQVAQLLAAKTSREAGNICRILFPSPDDISVAHLIVNENPQVAVHAAWRRYSRKVRRRELRFGSVNETLDPRDQQRFLGFLEGRAQILVPEWWEQALTDSAENLVREKDPSRRGWSAISDVVTGADDDHVTLVIQGDKIQVPATTFRWVTQQAHDKLIGVAKNDQHLLLLAHNQFAARSNLACIELTQSKDKWRNVVWGAGGEQVPARSGPPSFHHMSIEFSEDRVFVFGAMTNGYGMYLDGFSLKDGATLIRFATNNWLVKERSN